MIMIMMMISSGQEKVRRGDMGRERERESKEREERALERGESHRNKYKRAV